MPNIVSNGGASKLTPGSIVVSNYLSSLTTDAINNGGGLLDNFTTGIVRLFQNDFTPTRLTDVGAFTEADFTGYAEVANGAFDQFLNTANWFELTQLTTLNWAQTADTVQNTVYGWYMVTAAETSWLIAERFQSPVLFGDDGDFLNLLLRWVVPL